MIAQNMEKLVAGSSIIRALFEEGKEMAKTVGAENVYDYSLGNPSVPAPAKVKETIIELLNTKDSKELHGYMSNAGFEEVREAIAESLNKRYAWNFDLHQIFMVTGAAAGINVVMRTMLNPGDEVICFAPFFGEYRSYATCMNGVLKVVPPKMDDFQLNLDELDALINEKTKLVLVNNPNNPTGVIYSEETLDKLQTILEKAEERIGHPIYVMSDEPYRELAYDGHVVPFMPKHIKNCIIGYSFSKSLSLPGERIGYLAVSDRIDDFELVSKAIGVANRIVGSVNAPSLFQLVIKECLDETVDVEAYDKNRQLLYKSLTEYGFECIKPQGAFYLFVKSPEADESKFVEEAKKHHILMVPATSFGCPGYVRIAYCVSYDMIIRSLPAFKALAEHYL